jgi:hypothetical protein
MLIPRLSAMEGILAGGILARTAGGETLSLGGSAPNVKAAGAAGEVEEGGRERS